MIDVQEENFYDFYAESEILRKQNEQDGPTPLGGLEVNLDLFRYKILAGQGALVLVTARDAKKPVGYHISIVQTHLHFATIKFGFSDSYVVARSHRGQGIFNMMLAMSEHIWLMRGCEVAQMSIRGDAAPLLKRGYVIGETVLHKKLEV